MYFFLPLNTFFIVLIYLLKRDFHKSKYNVWNSIIYAIEGRKRGKYNLCNKMEIFRHFVPVQRTKITQKKRISPHIYNKYKGFKHFFFREQKAINS